MKKWTEKEVEFLKENYLKFTNNELGSALNRSKKQIGYKLVGLNLKRTNHITRSEILKRYYLKYDHHTKGKPKSEEQKKKMSIARKKYLERTDEKILKKIYRKMGDTKRRTGIHLGEKNSMYGRKRPDLSKRNRETWKNIDFRIKIKKILEKTVYKGSQRQREFYKFLKNQLGWNKVKFNDWKTLNYRYEIDISIPSKKIAIEWDGHRWHYGGISNMQRDMKKNQAILDKGWKFIRIKDDHLNKSEILMVQDMVIDLIKKIDSPEFKLTGGFYIE